MTDAVEWLLILLSFLKMGRGGGGAPGPSPAPEPYNPVLDPIPSPRGGPSPAPAPSPEPPTPAPWPAPTPASIPPFPGDGWEPDNPPPVEVTRRAEQLRPGLWAKGEGTIAQEMIGGRWITLRATKMNDKNGKPTIMGVVAYRLKAGGGAVPPPAPSPEPVPPKVVIPPVEPGGDGFATWLAQAREAAQAAGIVVPTTFTDGQLVELRGVYTDWVADPPMSFDELAPYLDRLKKILGLAEAPPAPSPPAEVLPPFPDGWTPDTPVRKEVATRANALLKELWGRGEGATQVEKVNDRWVTFVAQKNGAQMGVVAFRLKV